MSFEYVEEAAEGELSGYVFKVNVDAGDGYSGMTLTVSPTWPTFYPKTLMPLASTPFRALTISSIPAP